MPKPFTVTVLGSNSSLPHYDRMLSSHVVSLGNDSYLIDCGEGTQLQMTRFHIKRNRIKVICISHFHGDHLYGLPGLLSSYSHYERKETLTIIAPIGIKRYIDTIFEVSQVYLSYELHIIETDAEEVNLVYEDDSVSIHHFPLAHRIPTQGYLVTEKQSKPTLNKEKLEEYKLSVQQIKDVLEDRPVTVRDMKIEASFFQKHDLPPRSYVYCSDTQYLTTYSKLIHHATLLYHEATYMDELHALAVERGHSTTKEAAQVAVNIKAKSLLIGHYSSRYGDHNPLLLEAQSVFENTMLAKDGLTIAL